MSEIEPNGKHFHLDQTLYCTKSVYTVLSPLKFTFQSQSIWRILPPLFKRAFGQMRRMDTKATCAN